LIKNRKLHQHDLVNWVYRWSCLYSSPACHSCLLLLTYLLISTSIPKADMRKRFILHLLQLG